MASLREIRSKLKSVENIKKITQAMEMVSAARLRKSQQKTEKARPYLLELKEILNDLLLSSIDLTHPLVQKREVKKVGVVVIASDKGLCGAYNHNVFSTAKKFINSYRSDQVILTLIGHKAISHFDSYSWPIDSQLADWGGKITIEQMKMLTHQLIENYLMNRVDEVWLVYTKFHNILKQTVTIEKLLSIDIPMPVRGNQSLNYIFEQSEQEIFNEILPRYCLSKIQSSLNEAFTSELAARIIAMRAATKNADERIEELTLIRNKVRQTGITKELIEITSGAQSLKSSF